jgi:hypothetical protein
MEVVLILNVAALSSWNLLMRQPIGHLLLHLVVCHVALCVYVKWSAYGTLRPGFLLWRLTRCILRFSGVSNGRVSLLFPAGLEDSIDLDEVARWARSDLDDLAWCFDTRPRVNLTIVLLNSHRDLTPEFGRSVEGTILVPVHAVVLAADTALRPWLRNRLTYLFAAHWNGLAPPLLQVGLASWLWRNGPQRDAIEEAQRDWFESETSLTIDRGISAALAQQHVSYAEAGCFTGFLIDQFGWDRYQQFYCQAGRLGFRHHFQREFGLSFDQAWQDFLDETLAPEAESEAAA